MHALQSWLATCKNHTSNYINYYYFYRWRGGTGHCHTTLDKLFMTLVTEQYNTVLA